MSIESSPSVYASGYSWRAAHATLVVAMIVATCLMIGATIRRPSSADRVRGTLTLPAAPLSLDGASREGNPRAPVAMVEFSDFQCPFCRKFARDVLPALRTRYVDPGRVQLVFRHLPLVSIHPVARPAAEGAECAARQGRFREMHDALFALQRLHAADVSMAARELALDEASFDSCRSGEATLRLEDDASIAHGLAITGTPAFVIGRLTSDGKLEAVDVISGAQPVEVFSASFDSVLK